MHNNLVEIGGFVQSDRRRFAEVLGPWIRGENMEIISKDSFKTVEAWIISSDEGRVMGSWGRAE